MSLEEKINFPLASGTYLLASLSDYLTTAAGLVSKQIVELNPLIDSYLKEFGTFGGLLIPKLLIATSVLAACKYIDIKHKEKKTKVKAEYFLYPGALLTSVTGASWLLHTV